MITYRTAHDADGVLAPDRCAKMTSCGGMHWKGTLRCAPLQQSVRASVLRLVVHGSAGRRYGMRRGSNVLPTGTLWRRAHSWCQRRGLSAAYNTQRVLAKVRPTWGGRNTTVDTTVGSSCERTGPKAMDPAGQRRARTPAEVRRAVDLQQLAEAEEKAAKDAPDSYDAPAQHDRGME
jgi:hypothetical protein